VKKIEVDYGTFYVCAMAITVVSWIVAWITISVYTDMSVFSLFFPTVIISYIVVRICVTYFFEIK
jgi:hypothetical protein